MSEDIGAPVAYLVLKNGTAVFDRSGDPVGEVEHVLADEREDVFHGLLVKTEAGHRFASGDQVDGIYERAVILTVPADQLPEPSEETVAKAEHDGPSSLRRAWEWLIQPK